MEIIKDLTNEAYRAMEGLSASDIKALLANPYKFKQGIKRPASTAQNLGSAIHSLILEPANFERDFIVADFDRRTKAGKEQAEQAEASGKILLKPSEFETAQNVANSFKESDFYKENFIKDFGEAETSYFDTIMPNGFNAPVKVKCRPDYFNLSKNIIIDLKTTSSENGANANEFLKAVANYGYYIQAQWYLNITDAKRFLFVALETSEPYCFGVYELDHSFLDLAKEKIGKALSIYKNLSLYNKEYKSDFIDSEAQLLTAPAWLFYEK